MAFPPGLSSGLSTAGSVAKELAPVGIAVVGSALTLKWLTPKKSTAQKIGEGADEVTKYLGIVSTVITLWDRLFPAEKDTVKQLSKEEMDAKIQEGVEEKYAAEVRGAREAAADEKRLQEGIAAGIAQYVAAQTAAAEKAAADHGPLAARKAPMKKASGA